MRRLHEILRPRLLLLSAGVVIAAAGCGGSEGGIDAPTRSGVIEVEVPAGEGSGQPWLSSRGDDLWLSWLEPAGEGWAFRFAAIGGGGGPAVTIAEGRDFFVNWADVPSVTPLPGGGFVAHWLERSGGAGVAYGVRAVRSDDGVAWSDPWTPHDDSPTEHGFVSVLPDDDAFGLVWLDGRRFVDGPEGQASHEMTLRHREVSGAGDAGPEIVIDSRVCDCCPTDAARTAGGWVVVYRDRSADEIRDVHAVRLVDGEWSDGRPFHRDGWFVEGCPVEGPAVVAEGDEVAVAWFTAAGATPRVVVAFSDDQGVTFDEPIRVDDGDPVGRVGLVREEGGVRVSWIEGVAGGDAELRHRRVERAAAAGPSATVTALRGARAAGIPRMARHGDDVVFAWTEVDGDATRVRVARWSPSPGAP